MSGMLFIIMILVSFVIVRIGAIAFQLTVLEWSLAVMIATFANSMRPQQILQRSLVEWLLPFSISTELLPWFNLLVIILAVLIIYKVFKSPKLSRGLTNFLRKKVI